MWGGGFGGGWQGGNGQDGDRDRSSDSGDSRSNSTARTERKPRPRYTVDLPDLFDSVDSDQDGQVGLYEWKKSKRGLADFRKIDRDSDGFLTPAELVRADSIPSPNASNVAAAKPAAQVEGSTPATTPGPAANGPPASVAVAAPVVIEVDASNPLAMEAKKMFSLLDVDRDGSVSESEWRKSVKLKPLFEQLGVDLKQPMDSTTFVSHYVQIKTPKG
jgi:Ca2+-binding EF-hand superfamily protein